MSQKVVCANVAIVPPRIACSLPSARNAGEIGACGRRATSAALRRDGKLGSMDALQIRLARRRAKEPAINTI
jgi:hypothetical protein